jgi:ActR/RegA family two-component response regulator
MQQHRYLEWVETPPVRPAPLERRADAPRAEIRSVLIVDPNPVFLGELGASFGQRGLEVWIDPDLATALSVAASTRPDLTVCEAVVGGRSVLEALPELRRVNPGGRVAVATLFPAVVTATRAIRAGVDAFFTKPVSAALILRTLAGEPPQPEDA